MLGSSPFEGVDTPPKGLRNQPASSSGDWVRVASALFILGFDVGRDLQMSWLGDEVKAALEAKLRREGKFLVDDVHGLLVYEEQGEPVRPALSAAPIVVQQSSIALENVLAIASGSTLTDEQSLVSGRGESHPPALSEPGVKVSLHRAPTGRPWAGEMRCQ